MPTITGGGLAAPGGIWFGGSPPFARGAVLTAHAERLRAEDWPIEGSLQEVTEADPDIESVLDLLPVPGFHDDDADH